jgi:hypothetical protein
MAQAGLNSNYVKLSMVKMGFLDMNQNFPFFLWREQ